MSKIICDVCGTSYPETAVQCPICGCVRPGEVKVVAGDTMLSAEDTPTSTYTHVKGGRFSKANVRKRNSRFVADENRNVPPPANDNEPESEENSGKGNNKGDLGLTITVIALLLAIVAVVLYIILRFFVPVFSDKTPGDVSNKPSTSVTTDQTDPTQNSTVEATDDTTTGSTEDTIVTELRVDSVVTLQQADETFQLSVKGVNEGSTVTFVSEDEAVATVSEDGIITAVSAGSTVITVTCGDEQVDCTVICDFAEDVTDPTEEETTAPVVVDPDQVYTIDIGSYYNPEIGPDVTLIIGNNERESFVVELKDEAGNTVDVVWQDDNGLCEIDGNTVKAVKSGSTVVYTIVNGQKYSCVVRIW